MYFDTLSKWLRLPRKTMDGPNPYGRNFTRAMERADVRSSQIQKLTGASASTVGNWKRRGVPGDQAEIVAGYLKVDPAKISQQHHVHQLEQRAQHLQSEPEDRVLPAKLSEVAEAEVSYRRPPSAREYRAQRLVEILDEADLNHHDMDLIERLIERLSRK